ncbi:MAG: matrixin family metalloprotease, partial [Desulfobacterales bacterium]
MNLAQCETHRDEKGSLNLKMKYLTWESYRPTKHEVIRLLATLLLWFATVLSSATKATATISVPISDHDLIQQSVAIVVGQVKTIESFSDLQEGLIFTCITLTIDDVLKGDVSITELTIKQPGGAVGGTTTYIFGSPEFTTGEQVLLFLTCNADGTLRVAHFYQGKFSIVSDEVTGKKMVNRNDNPAQVLVLDGIDKVEAFGPKLGKLRELELFKARIRAMVNEESQRPEVRSTPSILLTPPSVTEVSELLPEFHTPNMSRWFEPDDGAPVKMRVNSQGEPDALGYGFEQIQAALQAWSGVDGSSFQYQDGGFTDADGFQKDGVSAISFGDPLGQMDPPTDCAGLLAIAGFMQDVTETRIVNGQSFFRIVEGDVVFNTGWKGCGFLEDFNNFAEVAAHELGHVLGLAHATDPEAIMYPYAHLDRRGASLGKDDIDGLVFLYPAPNVPLDVATLLSPSGSTDPTPTYTWMAVTGATWYYL